MTAFSEFKNLILDMQSILKIIQQDAFIDNFDSPEALVEWLEWRIADAKKLDEEYKNLKEEYGIKDG